MYNNNELVSKQKLPGSFSYLKQVALTYPKLLTIFVTVWVSFKEYETTT